MVEEQSFDLAIDRNDFSGGPDRGLIARTGLAGYSRSVPANKTKQFILGSAVVSARQASSSWSMVYVAEFCWNQDACTG